MGDLSPLKPGMIWNLLIFSEFILPGLTLKIGRERRALK
jgi:hypothetical protein